MVTINCPIGLDKIHCENCHFTKNDVCTYYYWRMVEEAIIRDRRHAEFLKVLKEDARDASNIQDSWKHSGVAD